MNKKHYSFLVLNFLVLNAMAQTPIVLNSVDLNNLVQRDTFFYPENLEDYDEYGKPETDALWDFTNATYEPLDRIISQDANTSTDFPEAAFSNDVFRPFGGTLSFNATIYSSANSSGIHEVGEAILADNILPLEAFTGNSDDKLVFPKQVIAYDGEEVNRKFPSAWGDNWMTTSKRSTAFNISIAAFGLNNTPGEYKADETITDTVVGWGEVRIIQAKTNAISGKIAVQQVHRKKVRVDSFFVGGSPAPKSLLDAFGLVQGSIRTEYLCYFYRQGEVEPLVEIDYGLSKYVESEDVLIHHDNFVARTAGVSAHTLQNTISVYPNPAKNYINVAMPSGDNAAWSYTITNLQGQVVMRNNFNRSSIIQIGDSVVNGMYVLQLSKNDMVQSVSKIAIDK